MRDRVEPIRPKIPGLPAPREPDLGVLVTANGNAAAGVHANDGCVIRGAVAFENDGDGVSCFSGCTVQTATARDNAGVGLRFLDALATYSTSSTTNDAAGTAVQGVARGGNLCVGAGVAAPPDCP